MLYDLVTLVGWAGHFYNMYRGKQKYWKYQRKKEFVSCSAAQ